MFSSLKSMLNMRRARRDFCGFGPAPASQLRSLLSLCVVLRLAAPGNCAQSNGSCTSLDFEFMLSTASVFVELCTNHGAQVPGTLASCPIGSSEGTAFAIASIVACSDSVTSAHSTANVSCHISSCACMSEDDDDCVDCPAIVARSFPCFTSPVHIANHPSCLRLWAQIPLTHISRQMSAFGRFSHAHDRFVFTMFSFPSESFPPVQHSTPSLGPWDLSRLNRWQPSHANEDEHLSALGLKYQLIRLGDEWPAALCLDGSKGAYYM